MAAKDFSWTDDELDLLLKSALVYKSKCEYEGLSWEGTTTKYEKIKELILERYPDKPSDNPNEQFPRVGKTEFITKERVSAKLKKMRTDYKKAVDSGRKSGGGRVVFTFYNLCESLWGGSPAVESVSTGLDSADVQDEAESITEELSERDEQEEGSSLSEADKSQEECKLDETTKKRRATITEMLNNRKEKKINQKLTSDAQFLNYAKEDLELKRKLLDRLDKEDSDFKESMTKINKTMETVGESISQSMMLLAQFLRPVNASHMPSPSMESQHMPHYVAYNNQPFHQVGQSSNMYRHGEAQGGMPVFEQPRVHRTRASNDPDANYFEL